MKDFFCFLIRGFFFPFYCLWLKPVELRIWRIFFVFWFGAFFSRFIAFGLSPSALGYDGFFLFFDLGLLFPYVFGLSPSALGYEGFFLFFDLGLLFPYYCLWFKPVELSLWRIFFVFWFGASFSICLPLV